MNLVPIKLSAVDLPQHLAWSKGLSFKVPHSVISPDALKRYQASSDAILTLTLEELNPSSESAEHLRELRAFTLQKPTSSRLPIPYQKIPPRLRSLLASFVGKRKRKLIDRWAEFPGWPLDLSADFLADLRVSAANNLFTASEHGIRATPVILSHDLDSPEGVENLVKYFLPIEEQYQARSANYVVPCAWPIDHGLLSEIKNRGHEIGVHGYDHNNLTPFASDSVRRQRVQAARPLIERYQISGYRAPSVLRTRELLRELATLYTYDSSIPTSGGLFPVPNNGCASARPFTVEGIIEIPLSLPRDGSLLFLGYRASEILTIWIDAAKLIARSGGVVVLLTHCEQRFSGRPEMLEIYKSFLEFISQSPEFYWSNTADVIQTRKQAQTQQNALNSDR